MTTDNRVQVRTLDWKEMVQKSWGKDWAKPEIAYEFGGRKFEDNPNGGPYTPEESEE